MMAKVRAIVVAAAGVVCWLWPGAISGLRFDARQPVRAWWSARCCLLVV